MIDPLDNLRTVAQDPASTTGQIVDALAACASLPDFPTDRFRLALQPSGWANVQITREQAVRACNSYADDHAYGVALRAQRDRERNRDTALRAFWTERGVEATSEKQKGSYLNDEFSVEKMLTIYGSSCLKVNEKS